MEKFGQEMGSVRVPAGELRELLSRLASSDGVMDSEQPTLRDVAEVSGRSVGEVAAALTAIRGSQVVAPARQVASRPQITMAIVGALALMFVLLGVLLYSGASAPRAPERIAAPAAASPESWPAPPNDVVPSR
ncbi:MAG: hypothetical protein WCK51_09370 [Armatimonadota bacterium]